MSESEELWRRMSFDPVDLNLQGSDLVSCGSCPLAVDGKPDPSRVMKDQRPAGHSKLLVVMDQPRFDAVTHRNHFAGPDGKLFKEMAEGNGLPIKDAYITCAQACLKPRNMDLSKEDRILVTRSCRDRVLAITHYYKPRAVIAHGQPALDVFTAETVIKQKQRDIECPSGFVPRENIVRKTCSGQGVKKWQEWSCTKCKKTFPELSHKRIDDPKDKTKKKLDKDDPPEIENPCLAGCGHETPQVRPGKWRPKNVTCDTCDGKKKCKVDVKTFEQRQKLLGKKGVAGGRIPSDKLPTKEWFAEPFELVPTHPPYRIRQEPYTDNQKTWMGQFIYGPVAMHYAKVKRYLYTEPFWSFEYEVFKKGETPAFKAWMEQNPPPYAIDIETNAKDREDVTTIKCIGFASFKTGKTCVIATHDCTTFDPLVQAFKEVYEDPNIGMVWQHGFGYDIPVIAHFWGFCNPQGYIGDLMTRHSQLHPDEPHNLGHISFCYSDIPAWKPQHLNVANLPVGDDLWKYCAMDVRGTQLAYQAMEAEVVSENLLLLDRVNAAKIDLACHLHFSGLPIDRHAQLQLGAEMQHQAEQALGAMREKVRQWGGIPPELLPDDREDNGALFNPRSTKQLLWVLYDPEGPLKLTPVKFTDKSKEPATNEDALLPYKEFPFIQLLLTYRYATKIAKTYVDSMRPGPDGRLRMTWNPTGARTGRFTTSPNAQNWNKQTKAMVVAPEGRILCGADYDQLELRILAALTSDKELIRRCKYADSSKKLDPEWDPHSYVASLALGNVFTDLAMVDPNHSDKGLCHCTKCQRKALRDGTKSTVYGLLYGAGAGTVYDQIMGRAVKSGQPPPPVTPETVKRTIDAFYTAFPDVTSFQEKSLASARKDGYLREKVFGKYRVFPMRDVPATEAANFGIQSFAASIMDWSCIMLLKRLREESPRTHIIAQVHDAVYCELDDTPEEREKVGRIVEESLACEIRMSEDVEWMPLTAAPEFDRVWSKCG